MTDNLYTEAEPATRYKPAARLTFARGSFAITAESAARLTFGFVDFDRKSCTYRRAQPDPEVERVIIGEALARSQHLSRAPDLGNTLHR